MSARPTTSHWGAYRVQAEPDGEIVVTPHPDDPAPSPLLGNIPGALRHATRVRRPAVRRGWLEHGPGPSDRRGHDPFCEVSWDKALDLVAAELARVRGAHGNEAIFGGSYGWASAGRFHHAQSQLHRFLALGGGYIASRNTYSLGTSEVLLPHLVGSAERGAAGRVVLADDRGEHRADRGVRRHPGKERVRHPGRDDHAMTPRATSPQLAARGTKIVLISPLRSDLPGYLDAEWHPVIPATDVALMLGLAHTLVAEGLHDKEFLDTGTRRLRHVRAVPVRRGRRRGKGRRLGRVGVRRRARGDQGPRAADGRRAHPGHGHLVAAAHPARRAAGLGRAGAGRDARPDRAARRRVRPRLRLHGRRRQPRPAGAAADPAPGPQSGPHVHPGRPDRGHAAATPAPPTTTTAGGSPTPTSGWCTGPAATRSTIIRTWAGCAPRSAGRTRSWCTSRTGPPPPGTPTSCCRPRPAWNAKTSAAGGGTRT